MRKTIVEERRVLATMRQCREAEKIVTCPVANYSKNVSHCRWREENLSLIFPTLDSQIDSLHVLFGGWWVVGGVWWRWVVGGVWQVMGGR